MAAGAAGAADGAHAQTRSYTVVAETEGLRDYCEWEQHRPEDCSDFTPPSLTHTCQRELDSRYMNDIADYYRFQSSAGVEGEDATAASSNGLQAACSSSYQVAAYGTRDAWGASLGAAASLSFDEDFRRPDDLTSVRVRGSGNRSVSARDDYWNHTALPHVLYELDLGFSGAYRVRGFIRSTTYQPGAGGTGPWCVVFLVELSVPFNMCEVPQAEAAQGQVTVPVDESFEGSRLWVSIGAGHSYLPGAFEFDLTVVPDDDRDGDGLLDVWETEGLEVDGKKLDLPAMGASPDHKDVFVEIDSMPNHRLSDAALKLVTDAFAAAPVDNPDGRSGINLHVDNGPQAVMDPATGKTWGALSGATLLGHQGVLGGAGGQSLWQVVDQFKTTYFAKERAPAFHYALSVHDIPTGTTGQSRDRPASDFVVALGQTCGAVDCSGQTTQQAGTFMHELGHNLGLRHGGGDDVNQKPNYLSVMNYAFQFTGLRTSASQFRMDYSQHGPPQLSLPRLQEAALTEATGLAPFAGELASWRTVIVCPGAIEKAWRIGAASIDWNCNGTIDPDAIAADVNGDGTATGVFDPFLDWPEIVFDGGAIGDLGKSLDAPDPPQEPPLQQLLASARALLDDYSAPTVRIDGHDPATITVTDDGGIDLVVVEADGTQQQIPGDGRTSLTTQASFTTNLTAVALDHAGNTGHATAIPPTPTTSPPLITGPTPTAPPPPARRHARCPRGTLKIRLPRHTRKVTIAGRRARIIRRRGRLSAHYPLQRLRPGYVTARITHRTRGRTRTTTRRVRTCRTR